MGRAYTQIATAADYSLRIAPLRLELAPGKVIDTFAYNGTVPGPVLRLREGRQVSIDIRNDTDIDDIIHWHGLYLPSVADGAMEEGSPMVERGGTHVHGEADRHPLVSQPRRGGPGSDAKLVRGALRLSDRRTGKRSRPL
jgi:hypothetical protein